MSLPPADFDQQGVLGLPMTLVLASGFLVVASFQLLLPVVPALLEDRGPHGAAGAATGILFVAMVVAELSTPRLQERWNPVQLLIAGNLMIAVPSIAYSMPQANAPVLLAATAIRGFGTGISVVVLVVLVTAFAPNRRGRAIGYYGVAVGLPGIFAPSLGVWLAGTGSISLVAVLAFVAALLAGAVPIRLLKTSFPSISGRIHVAAELRRPRLLLVVLTFALVSSTYGGLFTFVPVVLPKAGWASAGMFLLSFGTCRAIGRGIAGYLADRHASRSLLIGGIALSIAGLVVFAGRPDPLVVVIGAAAYGLGNGIAQTGAYLSMALSATRTDGPVVSALWNSAMDLGSAGGGAIVGATAALYGYSAAFWALPVVACIALATVATVRSHDRVPVEPLLLAALPGDTHPGGDGQP